MLNTPNILVDRRPIINFVTIKASICVVRIAIAELVPAAVKERIKGICFTARWLSAARTIYIFPSWVAIKWISWLVIINIHRKRDGKVLFWNGNDAAVFTMYERNRAAPVSLAAYAPITQSVLGRAKTCSKLFNPLYDFSFGAFVIHAIEKI